jgi:hypothetical protein
MGRMDNWQFYRHTNDKWSWSNVTLTSSSESVGQFDSFVQAMGNAMRHGFLPGLSKVSAIQAERRSSRR